MVLQRVYESISRDKLIPRSLFNGVPCKEQTFVRHVFGLDGTVKVSNEWQDEFTIGLPKLPAAASVELYEDAEAQIVAYKLSMTVLSKTYEVWLHFKFNVDPYRVKIVLQGSLPNAMELRVPVGSVKQKAINSKCVWFGTFDGEFGGLASGVGFDWSDVGGGASFDGVNGEVVFSVGSSFVVDPCTVGTSTSSLATLYEFQFKSFYANGRFWVFYYDGSALGWRSSTDAVSWSGFTSFFTGSTNGARFSVWLDEANTKVCVARCQGSAGNIYYRQGLLNGDGSITWDSSEVTITSDAGYDVTVCKDSNGYPWVAYLNGTTNDGRVCKATATDGSSWGTPITLWTGYGNENYVILPLTTGKMMCIKGVGVSPKSRVYDGSSWASEVSVTSDSLAQRYNIAAIAEGDNVHCVYLKGTSFDVKYVKYVYGTGWGSAVAVQSAVSSTSGPCVSRNSDNGDLYCFWANNNHVYYKKCVGGVWDVSATDWINESADGLTGNERLTCYYRSFSSKIGLLYETRTSSPYNVRFEYLNVSATTTKQVTDSLVGSDMVFGNKSLVLTDLMSLAESPLRSWLPKIVDGSSFSDSVLRSKPQLQASDALSAGDAVFRSRLLELLDSLGVSEAVLAGKSLFALDFAGLAETVYRHRECVQISDGLSLAELVAVNVGLMVKFVVDAVGLTDQSFADKAFLIVEQVQLTDVAYVDRILLLVDDVALAEVVEKSVGGVKTRLFLVLGNVAVQLSR